MSYKEKLNKIKTFIFDVDGVLTDGTLILHPSGEKIRTMNSKDGMAIRIAIKQGFHIAIISGGKSEGVLKRFKYLGISDVYLGCGNKKDALMDLKHIYDDKVKEYASKKMIYILDNFLLKTENLNYKKSFKPIVFLLKYYKKENNLEELINLSDIINKHQILSLIYRERIKKIISKIS